MSKLYSRKYFNDQELITNSENKFEKVKLEFSILHAKRGIYMIQAKLFDKVQKMQVHDYITKRMRNDKKSKIVFDNFFICDFYFQKEQKLSIIITKDKNTFNIETTIGEIIGSNCTYSKDYFEDESLCIKAQKIGEEEDLLDVKLIFSHISDPNYFTNNKMYYFITSGANDIYESAQNNDDGTFWPILIPLNLLEPEYTISFYNLQNKLRFSFKRTINELKSKKQVKKKFKLVSGDYFILEDKSEITKNFTFIDYIKSGVKIALSIGIDFTGSNGHPRDLDSLHTIYRKPNDYERAITECAKIVGKYDDDQLFPVFGFGAIINGPGSTEANMCFNLNFSRDPNIYGLENIQKVYRDCIEFEKLTFSGPTNFAPIIKKVISLIKKDDLFEYHILMILTDGVIDDLNETIDLIVEASLLPLSIIIVGIGNEDFSKMDVLDGDDTPLTSSTGKQRMRDLVQFVRFNQLQNKREELTMEILAEIPRQIVEYYQFKNLNPEKIEQLLQKEKNSISDNKYNFPNFEINPQKVKIHDDINNDNNDVKKKFSIKKSKESNNIKIFNNISIKPKYQINEINQISNNISYFPTQGSQYEIDNNSIKDSIISPKIIKSSRRPSSKLSSNGNTRLIPSIKVDEITNKSIKRNSTIDNMRSSIDSSLERLLNQKNPFAKPNIAISNDNISNIGNTSNNERYKRFYESIYGKASNNQKQNDNPLIKSGYNIMNTQSNFYNNSYKSNNKNNNNININLNNINNRHSFDEFSNFINLKKIPLSKTIFLEKKDDNEENN